MSVKRDYKQPTWQSRRRLRLHGLLVITMVIVGLFAALLVYISSESPSGPTPRQAAAPTETGETAGEAPSPDKPKYDFYTELPRRQVVISEDELKRPPAKPLVEPPAQPEPPEPPRTEKPKAQTPAPQQTAKASTGRYMVQAGSFRNPNDADRRKATIAMMGISARIETVTGKNGRKWHRVRVGPLNGSEEAKAMSQRLQANDIETLMVKVN